MSLYTMKLSDSVDTMEFNLLEVPIQDKDIEGAVDNVVLSGDIYTDFLWLKKRFTHKWSILCKDDYERLRGFYTRQFSNAEVPIYQLLDAPSPVEESAGSGEYIQITTTDSTAKLASVEMLGNAEQTTYSGKNLADLVPMTNGTITNSTYLSTLESVYDSTLRKNVVHMVASGAYPTALYTLPQRLESGKYYSLTITYKTLYTGTGGTAQKEIWVAPNWTPNNWATLGTFNNDNSKNQTGVSGAKWQHSTSWATATMRFYVDPTQYSSVSASYTKICLSMGYGVNSQTTAKELWIADAMLAEITQAEWNATNYTDEDYEPYVGGTPAPNPDYPQPISVVTGENVVKIEGKNLLDSENAEFANGYISSSDGSFTSGGGSTASKNMFYLSVGTYTFSNTENRNLQRVCYFSKNKVFVEALTITSGKTFTMPSSGYVRIQINGSTTLQSPQLELGSTATAYEPYQGQEFPIDLGSIELAKIGNYQDRIYKDDGKWYIEKQVGKVVLDGTENWSLVSTATNTARFKVQGLTSDIVINETSVLLMSNYFTCYPSNERTQDKIGITTYINQDLYIRTDVNSISTVAQLKTWLGTHNTTAYYALATPTTTEITNEALIAQLDALGASSLYLGLNNIGTETQNAVPTLVLGYYPYYPNEIISPKAVRMELTDGGIINACECRENVQITLRETVQ